MSGEVKRLSLGHKTTSTSRSKRELLGGYQAILADILPNETDITVRSRFNLRETNYFALFAFEGDLSEPTTSTTENEILVDPGLRLATSIFTRDIDTVCVWYFTNRILFFCSYHIAFGTYNWWSRWWSGCSWFGCCISVFGLAAPKKHKSRFIQYLIYLVVIHEVLIDNSIKLNVPVIINRWVYDRQCD